MGSQQVLILRKKFFYTDAEIDKEDPVQVNLVFGQVGRGEGAGIGWSEGQHSDVLLGLVG